MKKKYLLICNKQTYAALGANEVELHIREIFEKEIRDAVALLSAREVCGVTVQSPSIEVIDLQQSLDNFPIEIQPTKYTAPTEFKSEA